MKVERTWGPSHRGRGVALRTTATVEGQTYRCETAMADPRDPYYGVTGQHIDLDHRRRIMALIEQELFGERR